MRGRVRRARADPGGAGPGADARPGARAAVSGLVRDRRARVRAVVLLPRDPPGPDRDRVARAVPGAAPRRSLGAVRLPRAGTPQDLARAGARARRPGPDRRRGAGRRDLRRRPRVRPGGGRHVHALYAARRARRGRPRRGRAALLGLRVRDALLLPDRSLVELPGAPRRGGRVAARAPRPAATCRCGC